MTKTQAKPKLSAFRESEGMALLAALADDPTLVIAVDTETTGLRVASTDWGIGVSITALIDGEPVSHYFPVAHPSGPNLSDEAFEMLQGVLGANGLRPLIFANVQFDLLSLLSMEIDVVQNPFWDILTMANLIDENVPKTKSLDQLGKVYLEDEKVKDPYVEKEKKSGNRNITGAEMFEYACQDSALTYGVWLELTAHKNWVELEETTDVWPEKQRLIRVLIALRQRGILVDQDVAREMEVLGTQHMTRLRDLLAFNPGSHKDLERIFIQTLKLPVLKKSKKTGAPSFDSSVMEQYDLLLEKMDSPLAKQIKEYRGWQKATTACYRPYLELVDEDGRIRCSFNTHRTTTGRLSSSEPNLQQIPKESNKPWNGRVKECFVASPGYVLISADYSQLELRLATAYCGEESLKAIFNEDRDLFTEMSVELGMSRPDTKTFVYSMQYGAGEQKTMMQFDVTRLQAQKMRNNYYATYPKMAAFNAHCTMRAERDSKVRLWTGRYRHFQYRSESYKAMNSVIQGGAADLVERIMVRVFEETESDDCHMLLQVHDALVFEVREDMVEAYTSRIKALMEDVNGVIPPHLDGLFDVKFNVEVSPWTK